MERQNEMNKYEEAYVEIVDYIASQKDTYKKEDVKKALLIIKELIKGEKIMSTTMRPYDLYAKLLAKYGHKNMHVVAIEELSELQKELTKMLREDISSYDTKHLNEEMADALIVIYELMWLYGNENLVDSIIEEKYVRTWQRVNE